VAKENEPRELPATRRPAMSWYFRPCRPIMVRYCRASKVTGRLTADESQSSRRNRLTADPSAPATSDIPPRCTANYHEYYWTVMVTRLFTHCQRCCYEEKFIMHVYRAAGAFARRSNGVLPPPPMAA